MHQLEATLSWEIDFWGKNREAYESALGTARVADIDAYAARLALSVNIAQAYVQLQRAYLQAQACDEFQGYLVSKRVLAEEFAAKFLAV